MTNDSLPVPVYAWPRTGNRALDIALAIAEISEIADRAQAIKQELHHEDSGGDQWR